MHGTDTRNTSLSEIVADGKSFARIFTPETRRDFKRRRVRGDPTPFSSRRLAFRPRFFSATVAH